MFILIRKVLRAIGFNVHKGWRPIHRSGFIIECSGCGEIRSKMQSNIENNNSSWWETDSSGDGGCGDIKEKEPLYPF